MISEQIRKAILSCLEKIQDEEQVRVVYACESGSRAWGFASVDSDYDVRFIYLHRPEWYMTIDFEREPDAIERPVVDSLDLAGWDLRKALNLLRKSNPPLLEWLGSPIVYVERGAVASWLRELKPVYYSWRACMHHYLSMARGNYREFLKGPEVPRKKYLYVLRPVLAMLWIERDLGVVPTEFPELVERLVEPGRLRNAIDELLCAKRAGCELGLGPRIPAINEFLEQELSRLEAKRVAYASPSRSSDELSKLFRAALDEVWASS
jgi:predicted nucleotidyltransferase